MRIEIGSRLREERERVGLSQTALANACGTSKRTVITWEQGSGTPAADILACMAHEGMDVGYVVTGRPTSIEAVVHALNDYAECWIAVDQHLQASGLSIAAEKKRQMVDALYELSLQAELDLSGEAEVNSLVASLVKLAA